MHTLRTLFLKLLKKFEKGRLAQLVQSTWFTKGSGVRIPQRPLKSNDLKPKIKSFNFSVEVLSVFS